MKKYYLLTTLVCLFGTTILAQPVITYSGNAPQIGDVYNVSGAFGTYDPGQTGGNRHWDFSSVQPTISTESIAVNPASTPFAADFPDATISFSDTDPSYELYNYWEITNSEMSMLGMASDPGANQTIIHYPDPRIMIKYPFAYNDTYTDTYYYTYPSALMLIHRRGTIIATADAWGSVKTPADSYSSTLRIKKEKVYTDSVWNTGGELMSVTTHNETEYQWYTATSHYPVLDIQVTEAGSSLSYNSLAGGVENNWLTSQVTVWPNPADDIINVKLSDAVNDKIEIEIVSLTGQPLSRLNNTGNRQFSADVSKLTSGVYLLRLKGSSGSSTTSRFIVKR
jgi:hypothetical protein